MDYLVTENMAAAGQIPVPCKPLRYDVVLNKTYVLFLEEFQDLLSEAGMRFAELKELWTNDEVLGDVLETAATVMLVAGDRAALWAFSLVIWQLQTEPSIQSLQDIVKWPGARVEGQRQPSLAGCQAPAAGQAAEVRSRLLQPVRFTAEELREHHEAYPNAKQRRLLGQAPLLGQQAILADRTLAEGGETCTECNWQ